MKVINGIIHYTATEVSQLCGVSTQTIKLWNKASEQREEAGEGRLIPAPHTEPNGYKYWSAEDIPLGRTCTPSIVFRFSPLYNVDRTIK